MSAVGEYREYSKCFYPDDRLADKADAAIAELEAKNERLKALLADYELVRKQAEAALAERDRMLEWIAEGHFPGLPQAQQMWLDTYRVEARAGAQHHYEEANPDETFVLPSFRARAEEGS